jgi:hypothetical protein
MLPVGVHAKLSVVARARAVLQVIRAADLYEYGNLMESSFEEFCALKCDSRSVPRSLVTRAYKTVAGNQRLDIV